MQPVSSPRQTAQDPAAARTLAAQGVGYKNGQKSAKIGKNYEKNRFSLQQLPKKGHFRKEMHPFFFRLRRKKSQKNYCACGALYRRDPQGEGAIEFLESSILGFCPYTKPGGSDPPGPNLRPARPPSLNPLPLVFS